MDAILRGRPYEKKKLPSYRIKKYRRERFGLSMKLGNFMTPLVYRISVGFTSSLMGPTQT